MNDPTPRHSMLDYLYRGWRISYGRNRPVTGLYKAERYGVEMGAGTEEALRRMIDTKVDETNKES